MNKAEQARTYLMPPAWRIEGKPTPFTPWQKVWDAHVIEVAAAALPGIKRAYRFYAVRIRAN